MIFFFFFLTDVTNDKLTFIAYFENDFNDNTNPLINMAYGILTHVNTYSYTHVHIFASIIAIRDSHNKL